MTVSMHHRFHTGWRLTAEAGGYLIHLDPNDPRDLLPAAVAALLSPQLQRRCELEPAGHDDDGWECWLVTVTAKVTTW